MANFTNWVSFNYYLCLEAEILEGLAVVRPGYNVRTISQMVVPVIYGRSTLQQSHFKKLVEPKPTKTKVRPGPPILGTLAQKTLLTIGKQDWKTVLVMTARLDVSVGESVYVQSVGISAIWLVWLGVFHGFDWLGSAPRIPDLTFVYLTHEVLGIGGAVVTNFLCIFTFICMKIASIDISYHQNVFA